MILDSFYLIVDSAQWLERLLPCGVRLAQLRVKSEDDAQLREEIRRARNLCRVHGAQLIVNDHWRLAMEEDCDFVHLGQGDLDGADLAALRAKDIRFGLSTHDEVELERALAVTPAYVALGPIFPTRLKKMPFGPQGLEKIGVWKKRIGTLPLVAIGGLTPERAVECLQAGADSVAVVTDISLDAEPEKRAREWREATQPWRSGVVALA